MADSASSHVLMSDFFNKIYTENWWQKSSIPARTQVVIITFKSYLGNFRAASDVSSCKQFWHFHLKIIKWWWCEITVHKQTTEKITTLHVNKIFPWRFNRCLICKFSFSSKPLVNVRKGRRGGAKHLIQRARTCVTPNSPWNERHHLDWSAALDRTRKPNAAPQGGRSGNEQVGHKQRPRRDPSADGDQSLQTW